MERVASRVAELSDAYPQGLLAADGNYTTFLQRKSEFLDAHAAQQRSLANQVRKDLAWLSRGPQGRGTKAKGRIAESHERIDTLAEMKERSAAAERGGARLDFAAGGRKTRKLLAAADLSVTLAGRSLFSGVTLRLGAGDRLGLLGPNGSGKTTLIRALTGQLSQADADAGFAVRGEVSRADPAPRVAVFSQRRQDLPPDLSLRDALCPVGNFVVFRGQSIHVAGWARRFLFADHQLEQGVGSLSGGELARVHVARIMVEASDVLILDEPTNDLDIPTLETLEEALEDYPGAILLVTHDRAMIARLATEILALDGRGNANLYASLDQALAAADAAAKARAEAAKPVPAASSSASAAAASPAPTGRRVKLSFNEQREYDRIESDIAQAEAAVTKAEAAVADPKIIADHAAMAKACAALDAAHAKVAALYARWEALEAKRSEGTGPR